MKIAIVTCLWHRPELTEIFLRYYHEMASCLSGRYEVPLIAVISRVEDANLAREIGWGVIKTANSPLTGKFNAGFKAAGDMGADGVLLLGSDDFASPAYLAQLFDMAGYYFYVTPHGIHFYDWYTGEMLFKNTERTGVGGYHDKEMLASCSWAPHPAPMDRHIDNPRHNYLESLGWAGKLWTPDKQAGQVLVDVKTSEVGPGGRRVNIWPYSKFDTSRTTKIEPANVWRHFPEWLADKMVA